MTFAQPRDEQQHCVITDFAQTFQRDTGLTMASCRDIIQHSNSIFQGFSYLIQHLFSLIDSAIPCQIFTVKGLTISQRGDFYIELSQMSIHFTKNRYIDDNNNHCTDIRITTADLWSVPDFRINQEFTIYRLNINVFNQFYASLDNYGLITRTTTYGNIFLSLENFLKFKRIYSSSVNYYRNNRYINRHINYNINNVLYIPNQPSSTATITATQPTHCQPYLSTNVKIKHELADLIFDIKDNLTDSMYKEILEKVARIS